MATSRRPKVKAVIVSIYGTILEKMEPQPHAEIACAAGIQNPVAFWQQE